MILLNNYMVVDFKVKNAYTYLKLKDDLGFKLSGLKIIVKNKYNKLLYNGKINGSDNFRITKRFDDRYDIGEVLVFIEPELYYVDMSEDDFLAKVI